MAIVIQKPKGIVSNDIIATVPKTSNVERTLKVIKKFMEKHKMYNEIRLVLSE